MKTEGLKAMIDLALKSGQEDKIDAVTAEKLGFGGAELKRKWVAYAKVEAPDKKEHAFSIVPDKNPTALILSVWDAAGAQLSLFKAKPDGTLELAIRTKGNPGDKAVPAVALDLGAKATRDEYEAELEFYGTHALKLEPKLSPKPEPPKPKIAPPPKPNPDPKPEAPHGSVPGLKPGSKPEAAAGSKPEAKAEPKSEPKKTPKPGKKKP